jgi:hypothetical protein
MTMWIWTAMVTMQMKTMKKLGKDYHGTVAAITNLASTRKKRETLRRFLDDYRLLQGTDRDE